MMFLRFREAMVLSGCLISVVVGMRPPFGGYLGGPTATLGPYMEMTAAAEKKAETAVVLKDPFDGEERTVGNLDRWTRDEKKLFVKYLDEKYWQLKCPVSLLGTDWQLQSQMLDQMCQLGKKLSKKWNWRTKDPVMSEAEHEKFDLDIMYEVELLCVKKHKRKHPRRRQWGIDIDTEGAFYPTQQKTIEEVMCLESPFFRLRQFILILHCGKPFESRQRVSRKIQDSFLLVFKGLRLAMEESFEFVKAKHEEDEKEAIRKEKVRVEAKLRTMRTEVDKQRTVVDEISEELASTTGFNTRLNDCSEKIQQGEFRPGARVNVRKTKRNKYTEGQSGELLECTKVNAKDKSKSKWKVRLDDDRSEVEIRQRNMGLIFQPKGPSKADLEARLQKAVSELEEHITEHNEYGRKNSPVPGYEVIELPKRRDDLNLKPVEVDYPHIPGDESVGLGRDEKSTVDIPAQFTPNYQLGPPSGMGFLYGPGTLSTATDLRDPYNLYDGTDKTSRNAPPPGQGNMIRNMLTSPWIRRRLIMNRLAALEKHFN